MSKRGCEAQREMSLEEWSRQLPAGHRARKEFSALRMELAQLRPDEDQKKHVCQGCEEHFLLAYAMARQARDVYREHLRNCINYIDGAEAKHTMNEALSRAREAIEQ